MSGNLEGSLNYAGGGELIGVTSATQLPDRPCVGVMFKAAASNTGNAYIGGPGVTKAAGSTTTTAGWELDAGEATPFFPCTNTNEFYRICDGVADDLMYMIWTH